MEPMATPSLGVVRIMEPTEPRTEQQQQELELLEKAFLMFGLAGTDEELTKMVKNFLIPVTLKMTSPHESVIDKTMEVLNHMTKRLQSRPAVQLPVLSLLEVLKDSSSLPVVQNFVLVYLKLGIPRLNPQAQADTLPYLVEALVGKSQQQIDSIFQLYTSALVHVARPFNKLTNLSSLIPSGELRQVFLNYLLSLLMTPYSHEGHLAPPGLSINEYKQVTGDKPILPNDLEKMKIAVVHLLTSDQFEARDVLVHLVLGASDARYNVYELCDQHLKQLSSFFNYEHSPSVMTLFDIFLGKSDYMKRTSGSTTSKCSPANLRMRLRILPVLLKSTLAANSFPACIQVIYDCLFGSITNTKLQLLGLEFLLGITSKCSLSILQGMTPLLLTALYKILNNPENRKEKKLLLYAYSGIANISKKVPHVIGKDTKHLFELFEQLEKSDNDDREMVLAVQECLNTLVTAYKGCTVEKNITLLESIMLANITGRSFRCRLAAAYCARSIFCYSHIPSRYVSLMACGDVSQEVREEGTQGLKPSQDEIMTASFPLLPEMINYIYLRATAALNGDQCYIVGVVKLPFPPSALRTVLIFLYHCLIGASPGCGHIQDVLKIKLDSPLETNIVKSIHDNVLSVIDVCNNDNIVQKYLDIITMALSPSAGPLSLDGELASVGMLSLLQIVMLSDDEEITKSFIPKIKWIKGFTQAPRLETREAAARLIGYLSARVQATELLSVLRESLTDTNHAVYPCQLSGVLILGQVGAVAVTKRRHFELHQSEIDNLLQEILTKLLTFSHSLSGPIVDAMCSAIGEIARSGPLPLPDVSENDKILSKEMLFKKLTQRLEDTVEEDTVLREKCAHSIGYFSIGDPAFPYKKKSLTVLTSLREQKHIDLHFSIGEALSCIAAGQYSDLAINPWDYMSITDSSVSMDIGGERRDTCINDENDMFENTLDLIIDQYGYTSSPRVRQAACVWILSLLQHCQNHPFFQKQLPRFQHVFLNFLSENNDVLQEVASQGLGLVYELSDPSLKQELVQYLVGTLMEGKQSTTNPVSNDTKMFSSGVSLGKTPQGSGLSTYKELCSLASDLNQPDLIYKFMGLARHHAMWNSKKGAAFGVSSIAKQARDQLIPYYPTLVPRLYRYKYDPITTVQQAMTNIWNAVIPETNKTVSLYFKEIIIELCSNLSSNQWRNRESSCLALRDILSTNTDDTVLSEYLSQLWQLVLRTLDDIKETVRKSAESASKSLLSVTVRMCDGGGTNNTVAMTTIKSVLPIFLTQGTTHPAQDVRAICLLGLLKLIGKAGPLLKPHIGQIVPLLLQSLSSLEPQALNTISLQLGSESEIQEKLETIRVSATKTSPLNEAINLCMTHIDSEVLVELVPHLVDIIKSGVGLATKVSCADFIINLSRHSQQELSPHAGKLLGSLLSGLSDRSTTVRKSYAKAIGYVIKVAKEACIRKLVERLKKMYLEKGDSSQQLSVAYTIHEMSLRSTDTTKDYLIDLAPLIFLAMHTSVNTEDPNNETVIKVWTDTWQELVPSTSTGIKLYEKEILDLICPSLSSQSWDVKRQAAGALATLSETMGIELVPPSLTLVLQSLLEGLQGRLWDGKDSLLISLKTVCVSCASAIKQFKESNQPNPEKIVQCLLSQCKKQSVLYKSVAINVTGKVTESLHIDVFSEFYDIITVAIHDKKKEDRDEVMTVDDAKSLHQLKVIAYEALGSAWLPMTDLVMQCHWIDCICDLLGQKLVSNTWKIQCAILKTLANVFKRSTAPPSDKCLTILNESILISIGECLKNPRFMSVRQDSLYCLDQVIIYIKKHERLNAINEHVVTVLYEGLVLLADPQLQTKAMNIMTTIGK